MATPEARQPGRRRRQQRLERVLGTPALFATAYGNVGSSIYYALGLVAGIALGLTPLVFLISGLIFAATAATYAEGTVRYPEAGGSSSFARHAFNELVSFGAAWAQMLNYVITIAISAFFVPHYLSIFWEPLRENPWDIVGGVAVVVLLVLLNIVGIKEAARLNIFLAVVDFATQLLLVIIGFALIFDPHIVFSANLHWGVAPTWSAFFLAIPIAMIAYTGIETVSNLAEEARDPPRDIPRSISWVAIAVFAIYFTLPMIALSALPVHQTGDGYETLLGLPPEEGGFENDPVLGLVQNLGLHGTVLDASKIYVGILAATILLIATNAGVIGASRITYAMSSYRQLPEMFRRLHPMFKTPWLALVVFAGVILGSSAPAGADGLSRRHVRVRRDAVVHDRALRCDRLTRADPGRPRGVQGLAEPASARGRLAAVRGVRWARDRGGVVGRRGAEVRAALGGARLARRRVCCCTSCIAATSCDISMVTTQRAPVIIGPAVALEYRSILVPVKPGRESEEAIDFGCRLATDRGASISAVSVVVRPARASVGLAARRGGGARRRGARCRGRDRRALRR